MLTASASRRTAANQLVWSRFAISLLLAGAIAQSSQAASLRFSFTDPAGDSSGQVDVVSVVVVFESTTGAYTITVSTDPSGPFFGGQRVNANFFNPDTGTRQVDPAFFSRSPILSNATPTASVAITGTNSGLMSWKIGNRVAANSATFGVPDDGGIVGFFSAMRDWPPPTPPAMGIDYFGDLPGEYAVIELDPAMWQKLLSEVAGIGPGTSFTDKVVNAQTYYAVPDVQATCAVLSAFVSEVKVQAGKKKLTDTQAATLTSDAQDIATAIGCNCAAP